MLHLTWSDTNISDWSKSNFILSAIFWQIIVSYKIYSKATQKLLKQFIISKNMQLVPVSLISTIVFCQRAVIVFYQRNERYSLITKSGIKSQELQWRKTFPVEFATSKVNHMVFTFCAKHKYMIHIVLITSNIVEMPYINLYFSILLDICKFFKMTLSYLIRYCVNSKTPLIT